MLTDAPGRGGPRVPLAPASSGGTPLLGPPAPLVTQEILSGAVAVGPVIGPDNFVQVDAGGGVSGATMAGAPLVILGHNGQIAWGYTTTNADVEDVVHERTISLDVSRIAALTTISSTPIAIAWSRSASNRE